MLFHCRKAKLTWFASPMNYIPASYGFQSFRHWWIAVYKLMQDKNQSQYMELAVIICWQIWKNRNLEVFQFKHYDPRRVAQQCSRYWGELQEIQDASRSMKLNHINAVPSSDKWHPLPPEAYKVNCDASFSNQTNQAQLAFICRDHRGKLIHGAAFKRTCSSATVADALAVREATRFVRSHNLNP